MNCTIKHVLKTVVIIPYCAPLVALIHVNTDIPIPLHQAILLSRGRIPTPKCVFVLLQRTLAQAS